MHLFASCPSIFDADLVLRSLYEKDSRAYWQDAEVDRLVKAQRAESDHDKRRPLIWKIWELSKANVPYAILYDEIQAYGIRNGVNWSPRPDGRLTFQDASLS